MLGPEGQELERTVNDLVAQNFRWFVFDMSGITHIDSTGIGRCISSYNRISQVGGKLLLAGAAGQVRESFRVTRLDRVFRFVDDVPAAIASLA